jgi:UDP-GlcNAc:undecaprenyl-phosphate GlcNAc-1-phosphate transferase
LTGESYLVGELSAFLITFSVTIAVTPLVRKYALRWRLGDKPNGRKVHVDMIPHLGGVAIVLGAVCGLTAAAFLAPGGAHDWNLLFRKMFPAVALIVALGLVDDMKSLRAVQKLTVQIISAALLGLSGFLLYTGAPAVDGIWVLSLAVTVSFVVGVSSAVNLIDGHDGLAAGVSLIASAAFAVMAALVNSSMLAIIALVLGGACAAFLVFNFPPGKIFMGDTGSMFLGITLAVVACSITMVQPTFRTFVAVCFVLGVPMLDACLAVARRLILRSPLFRADCLHMHHIMKDLGASPRRILFVLYSMEAFLAALGVLVLLGYVLPAILGVALIVVAFVTFLRIMVASRTAAPVGANLAASSLRPLKSNVANRDASLGR